MSACCVKESILNGACLIILSYIAVYNRDTYAHVSQASVKPFWYVIRYVNNKPEFAFGNCNTEIL